MKSGRWIQFGLVAGSLWALAVTPAGAWTRAGHMVSAAIAYDDLAERDPKVIEQIVAIMAHHPERGPFEVAIGRATGEDRTRRIFMQIARWPDDIRGGSQDHPSWHAAIRPVIDSRAPPPQKPANVVAYEAYEALALNVHLAADTDPRIPESERAVALCWIFHIVGDIHQPLHTAELYSEQFPNGDQDGSLEFVLDRKTGQPINLHWYWDDLVSQTDDPDKALARAAELKARYPRAQFASELSKDRSLPANITAWADESFALAKSLAYGPNMPRASTPQAANAPDEAYVHASTAAAEQRLTLSGYRLADLLLRIYPRH